MASLPQMSAVLGSCVSSNNIFNTPPRIAQLCNNTNLVAKHQIAKRTLFPIALVGQKKPIELWKQCQSEKWKARNGLAPELQPPSPVEEAVTDFYEAFNARDIVRLQQLLSPECVYQDFLFYSPFQGIERVKNFWLTVMDAMGPNISILVDNVNEDDHDHHMATVFWHLEWNHKKIPFTNGCRFFTFEEVEGRLVIRKITGLEEFPLKPGDLVLKMLKAVRTILDSFPPGGAAVLELLASQELQDGSIHDGKTHEKH